MQNSQANTKKIFTKFFWRAGKVTDPRAKVLGSGVGKFSIRIARIAKIDFRKSMIAKALIRCTFLL